MSLRIPYFTDRNNTNYEEDVSRLQNRSSMYSILFSDSKNSNLEVDDTLGRLLYYHELALERKYLKKRTYINDIRSVLSLINNSSKIVVILGAGGSVGPDFRSPGGLYDSIAKAGVLDDPCSVFDIESFMKDPSIFWRFAHTIFPKRNPEHSDVHRFLASLHKRGKLLRLYSQNVDTLEYGISPERLRCVHGSWRENICTCCGTVHGLEDIRPYVEQFEVPICRKCSGSIKPGIVFFGQNTNLNPTEAELDSIQADLLLVIGTSLRVAPISELPKLMKHIPTLFINRAHIDCEFSSQLLGECSDIIHYIENELGWEDNESIQTKDIQFFGQNSFIFPSTSELASRIQISTKANFLITSVPCDVADLM